MAPLPLTIEHLLMLASEHTNVIYNKLQLQALCNISLSLLGKVQICRMQNSKMKITNNHNFQKPPSRTKMEIAYEKVDERNQLDSVFKVKFAFVDSTDKIVPPSGYVATHISSQRSRDSRSLLKYARIHSNLGCQISYSLFFNLLKTFL